MNLFNQSQTQYLCEDGIITVSDHVMASNEPQWANMGSRHISNSRSPVTNKLILAQIVGSLPNFPYTFGIIHRLCEVQSPPLDVAEPDYICSVNRLSGSQ